MSVAEEAIRKTIGRVNAPLDFLGITNSPRYHVYRFHAYRECPQKMEPDVVERAKRSIQEYAQRNLTMVNNRSPHGSQLKLGKTASATERFIFT